MKEQNISIVKQCYTEFGKGNVSGVLDLLSDTVTWIDPGYPQIPYAGKRNGKNEVAQFFTEMVSTVTFTNFVPQDFFCDGNMVTVKGYFTGKSNTKGKSFETEWVMLWEVKGGKVVYYQAFIDTSNVASAIN